MGRGNVRFFIQPDSDIPPSTQLFDQLSFAITSRQYEPGDQLPSTRQLAQWTGLHRNTINKVYQQLKQAGLVEARGGSGMYVSTGKEEVTPSELPAHTVRSSLDRLLALGCTLPQVREMVLAEIDWRLRCSAQILVTTTRDDLGVGRIMADELERALSVPIEAIALEDADTVLEHASAATLVTTRYFLEETRRVAEGRDLRVICLDIYDFKPEIARIHQLPAGSYVGIVSMGMGILRVAESLIRSFRRDELVVMTCLPQDSYRLHAIAKSARIAFTGFSGEAELDAAIAATCHERMRPLEVVRCRNYITAASIDLLKLELGITDGTEAN